MNENIARSVVWHVKPNICSNEFRVMIIKSFFSCIQVQIDPKQWKPLERIIDESHVTMKVVKYKRGDSSGNIII